MKGLSKLKIVVCQMMKISMETSVFKCNNDLKARYLDAYWRVENVLSSGEDVAGWILLLS